jgi:hypothetical protein
MTGEKMDIPPLAVNIMKAARLANNVHNNAHTTLELWLKLLYGETHGQ